MEISQGNRLVLKILWDIEWFLCVCVCVTDRGAVCK